VDHPRLKVVSHAEIFQNQSHLPTFSSPAIETHLHRLPGLSDKFVYLNDDVMFGNEVWPEDFYTRSNGQKVYLSWAVPNCKDGCPSNWIGDKYCDAACNHPECDFDGGDCTNATANTNRWWGGGKKWSPPVPPAHQPAGNNAPNTSKSRIFPLFSSSTMVILVLSNPHSSSSSSSSSSSFFFKDGHVPPPPANYGSRFAANYCAKSCPDSWVGDKYCDRSCQNADCGFDAGDCGVEMLFHGLFGANITNQVLISSLLVFPLYTLLTDVQ
jgi:UDP-N-acetylglucosamine-lysosomal-enzyme